jgi:uncharacterized membrane protein YiaA
MKMMSEGECVFYIAVFILLMFGTMVYAERQRQRVERLERLLQSERELLSRLMHPARPRRND